MNEICPYIGKFCIGKECSEFVSRYKYKGYYHKGIQYVIQVILCWITRKEYKEPFYISKISAHCKSGISSTYIWDTDEYIDENSYDEREGMKV